jgi:hypothetical protein
MKVQFHLDRRVNVHNPSHHLMIIKKYQMTKNNSTLCSVVTVSSSQSFKLYLFIFRIFPFHKRVNITKMPTVLFIDSALQVLQSP